MMSMGGGGIGYQQNLVGSMMEEPSKNVISLPLKFLSNGRPHQIGTSKKKKPSKDSSGSSSGETANLISGGKYSFNGRPTAVFVVRSPASQRK